MELTVDFYAVLLIIGGVLNIIHAVLNIMKPSRVENNKPLKNKLLITIQDKAWLGVVVSVVAVLGIIIH